MKAKDYFRRVLRAESELKLLREKVRHYEELGLTITSNTSAVGGHHQGSSRVELAAVGAVDATRNLDEQIKYYTGVVARAEQVIRQIPQEKYRQILTYRYICGWSLKSISDELDYSDPNSIYRAHGYALSEAQGIINRLKDETGVNGTFLIEREVYAD